MFVTPQSLADAEQDRTSMLLEQTLERSIDALASAGREYKAQNSGLLAAWERMRGNPGLTPIRDDAAALKRQISSAPLTPEIKTRLLERFGRVEATIEPSDVKLLVAGGVIFLLVKGLSAAASAGASVAAEKAKEKFELQRKLRRMREKKARKAKDAA